MTRLLSARETADLCNVDEATVLRWIDTCQLACDRLPGGYWRIEPSVLVEFLRAHGMPIPDELQTRA